MQIRIIIIKKEKGNCCQRFYYSNRQKRNHVNPGCSVLFPSQVVNIWCYDAEYLCKKCKTIDRNKMRNKKKPKIYRNQARGKGYYCTKSDTHTWLPGCTINYL